ncbi:MAG: electron transfer flavoprotein subunit alpha/FixB family protein [Bacteroidota bacterium]|nr:electron transfer flavoprotein subunit alpha/FixB family protein [Bacteroidota bacterium]
MIPRIVVLADTAAQVVRPVTREVCTAAQRIADAVDLPWGVIVPAASVTGLEDIPTVVRVDTLAEAVPDVRASALTEVCRECAYVMMAHTTGGGDLMARMAQHLDVPLAADCVGLTVEDQQVRFVRALYGGKVLSTVRITARPIMATFRPRSLRSLFVGENCAVTQTVSVELATPLSTVSQVAEAVRDRLDVTEADIVISGGRGMQGPEQWGVLEELAAAFGPRATLACSRPVSDNGWRPRNEHVGQTGRAISPDLYIACGISGAIQHVAGIARSRCIVAINKDPDAPIFKVADYGIVGDLFDVVPALTAAIRQLR